LELLGNGRKFPLNNENRFKIKMGKKERAKSDEGKKLQRI
jgi:hypothetical protein